MGNRARVRPMTIPADVPVSSHPEVEDELGAALIQSATYSYGNSREKPEAKTQPILSIRGRDVRDKSDFKNLKRPA